MPSVRRITEHCSARETLRAAEFAVTRRSTPCPHYTADVSLLPHPHFGELPAMHSRSCVVLITALISASACNQVAEPPAAVLLRALDPSDPAQAAIIRWHQSLLANDYQEF